MGTDTVISLAGVAVSLVGAWLIAKKYGDVAGTLAARRFQEEDAKRARVAAFQSLINEVVRIREVAKHYQSPNFDTASGAPKLPVTAFETTFVSGSPGLAALEEVAQTPDDLIEFVIRSANLQFELTEQGNEILSLLSECASLHELAQHLERSQQDFRWYWLDLYFGIQLRYGTASTGTWGASEIWHNALEPWTPWVRAGSIGRSDW